MNEQSFIVKVQVPLSTNDPNAGALVYNEDRSVQTTFPIEAALVKRMNGAKKQFFYAAIENTKLILDRKAPWQDW